MFPGTTVHPCSPITGMWRQEDQESKRHHQFCRNFEASLGYMILFLKSSPSNSTSQFRKSISSPNYNRQTMWSRQVNNIRFLCRNSKASEGMGNKQTICTQKIFNLDFYTQNGKQYPKKMKSASM